MLIAVALAAAAVEGLDVHGIDIDAARVGALSRGESVVPGVDDGVFAMATDSGRLSFGTDFARVADADVVVICVPTPITDHRPDLGAVEGASRLVSRMLRPGQLVILESTTYPGTTEELLVPLLEAGSGLTAGTVYKYEIVTIDRMGIASIASNYVQVVTASAPAPAGRRRAVGR